MFKKFGIQGAHLLDCYYYHYFYGVYLKCFLVHFRAFRPWSRWLYGGNVS